MFDVKDPGLLVGVRQVVERLLSEPDARTVALFLSPTLTVKATKRNQWTKRDRQRIVLLTIGQPNYHERELIRRGKRAGVRVDGAFDVKKLPEKAKSGGKCK